MNIISEPRDAKEKGVQAIETFRSYIKVRIKVFAQIKYKLKQRIWFWNTLVQLFIFHSPMHQAALTLCSSFNSGFETLVLLKHISFNNFESDRVVFFIYCFDYLLSNFSFPICSFKLEESIKDVNIRLLQRKRKYVIWNRHTMDVIPEDDRALLAPITFIRKHLGLLPLNRRFLSGLS
ncbi:hypothetical protein CFP56_021246 [Quercus suber]|uniref:Uncharacterized protein n=1 Tax=Quercus suber TaxID=58331 RepID=A0AAW0KDU0_QUESU